MTTSGSVRVLPTLAIVFPMAHYSYIPPFWCLPMAQKKDLWYSDLSLVMFNMGRLGFRLTLAMVIPNWDSLFQVQWPVYAIISRDITLRMNILSTNRHAFIKGRDTEVNTYHETFSTVWCQASH